MAGFHLEQGAVIGAHDELAIAVHEFVGHEVQFNPQVRAPVDIGVDLPVKFGHHHGLAIFLKFPGALVFDVVQVANVFHGASSVAW